jgi:hypothetical protein
MADTTYLEPKLGEEDKITLQNDITYCLELVTQFTTPEPLTMGRDLL